MSGAILRFYNRSLAGTSARLTSGMEISVWDLLFGLMLPSGNDSAVCIAETVGSLMYCHYNLKDVSLSSDSDLLYDAEELS